MSAVDGNVADMLEDFHNNYGKDAYAALHAAYDLITYLEQKGVL
jgi:hypothetical protein